MRVKRWWALSIGLLLNACGDEGSAAAPGPVYDGPPIEAGIPGGSCSIPAEAQLEDVSDPRTVIGDGTRDSCTGAAFVDAVAQGGVITFDCGPEPVIVTLTE